MMNERRQGYRFGPFSVELEQRVLLREGQPVPLRPKDFDMLVVLVENVGRIVEKNELMKRVWPDTFVEEANLSHHVFTLRKALGDDKDEPRYIETVPRRGYRFVAPVTTPVDPPESPEVPMLAGPPRTVGWRWPGIVIPAALLVTAAAGAYAAWSIKPAPGKPIVRLPILLNPGDTFTDGPAAPLAVSPDGTRVAYTANGRLYLRPLDRLDATAVPGVERPGLGSARTPFFSPDGRWIGYWELRQMKKVSVEGGPPIPLCDLTPPPFGATWSVDDTILIGHGPRGIWRVPASGGTCDRVIAVGDGERAHGPQLMPDGRHVLFTLARTPNWDEAEIVVQSLKSGARRTLVTGADGRYLPTGHLIYVVRDTLHAVRLDPASLRVIGTPVTFDERVRRPGSFHSAAHVAVAASGTLSYVEPRHVAAARRTLVWVDREGREEPLGAEPRAYVSARMSPDGSQLALDIQDGRRDIWLWNFARRTLAPVTTHPAADMEPVWTPDGKRLIFLSMRTGVGNLFWQPADGSSTAERLTDGSRIRGADSMTPDGAGLVLRESDGAGTNDLSLLNLGAAGRSPLPTTVSKPLVVSSVAETNAEVSPDGQWLAYQSNVSGTFEIWVRPFAQSGGQFPVSSGGGTEPLWGRNSRELFFRDANGAVMRVAIARGAAPARAVQLFPGPLYALGGRGEFGNLRRRTYDVSPDGRRFVMIKVADAASPAKPESIVVVQNWFEELKRKLPIR